MKKMFLMLGLVSMLSVTAFAEKIGVVNTEQVIAKYSGTRSAEAFLKREAQKVENEINQRQVALQKEQVALESKGDKLTDKEKKAFEAKVEGFYKYVNSSQQSVGKLQQNKMGAIFKKANQAVQAVAAEGNYDYVLDQAVVLVGGEDITDKVLKKMETIK